MANSRLSRISESGAKKMVKIVKKESKTSLMQKIERDLSALKTPLATERKQNGVLPVIGEGSLDAKIMFIGEAPGKNEAKTGRPFCGASGKFLSELLESINLKREDVYITNLVKDRPTDNRDPTPLEVAEYSPFLDRQIEVLKPRVIATLGRFSMAYIMNKYGLEGELSVISKIHGKVYIVKGSNKRELKIIPLYHPAVALYNGSNRPVLMRDFQIIKNQIK
jgi:uracil-DNA glycosylase family 4